MAYDHGALHLQAKIKVRMEPGGAMINSTAGRVLLFEGGIPKKIPFAMVNKNLGKKELNELIDNCYRLCGQKATVLMADYLRSTGYTEATKAGISICMEDMVIPEAKKKLLTSATAEVKRIMAQYADGLITSGERYNKIIDIWANVSEQIANAMMEGISKMTLTDERTGKTAIQPSFNSIYIMADSGARGSRQQMRQLSGMRGLMAKPSGEIIEFPITTNFREGLTVLQYFISTHGARKGLADTALKTANSGYLTRRLVDVAQEAVITEFDCGTIQGLDMTALVESGEIIERLGDRILGRVALEPVYRPGSDEVIIEEAGLFDEAKVAAVEEAGIQSVKIRSVLTCEALRGICAKCYGRDLARGNQVDVGEAVGIIAAQSIGEPGTQLTMRTFHIGGVGNIQTEQTTLEARFGGEVKLEDIELVHGREDKDGPYDVVMNRHAQLHLLDEKGRTRERYDLVYGAKLRVKQGEMVKPGQLLSEWDPYTLPIISEVGGVIEYGDIIEGVTMQVRVDEITNHSSMVIQESRDPDARPRFVLKNDDGEVVRVHGKHEARYFLPVGAAFTMTEGTRIQAGDVIAKMPRETTKTKDITGGLPARRRAVRGADPEGPRDHLGDRRHGVLRQGQGRQAPRHRHARARRPEGVPGTQGPPPARPRGRPRPRRREAHGRPGQPARHPRGARREGPRDLPAGRDPGGLPPAGREDQRQAHRDDHPSDDAPRPRQGAGGHQLPRRRPRRAADLPAGEPSRRLSSAAPRPPARRCCSASPRPRCRRRASSAPRRSRRPPRCSPRRPSRGRSTSSAASRRTSSWAASSRRAPASPSTSASTWAPTTAPTPTPRPSRSPAAPSNAT
jgi:DNA-directed RNA polymerase subunit beta'